MARKKQPENCPECDHHLDYHDPTMRDRKGRVRVARCVYLGETTDHEPVCECSYERSVA